MKMKNGSLIKNFEFNNPIKNSNLNKKMTLLVGTNYKKLVYFEGIIDEFLVYNGK